MEEEAATVAASRVAAPRAVMVVSSFAALPHLGRGASVCFLWAREGATLFLAASNARFVAREDALRFHVHAGSEAKDRIETCKLGSPGAKQDYSCPSAVPTAVNRRATLNGPV